MGRASSISWFSKSNASSNSNTNSNNKPLLSDSTTSPTGLARTLGLQRAKARALDSPKSTDSSQVEALIESHLSSRKEPSWEQEFSSMSSCRSDLDSSKQGQLQGQAEFDDDESLPPLLRNPHIAEFDIVHEGDEEEGCSEAELELELEPDPCSANSGTMKKRRNHSYNSFSASLPAEIKGAVADSIPLVKYSHNPYQDFWESMAEMIQEKELQSWSDLEELLFCYLSLNSPEHHAVITQSFWDVWHHLGSSTSNSSSSTS